MSNITTKNDYKNLDQLHSIQDRLMVAINHHRRLCRRPFPTPYTKVRIEAAKDQIEYLSEECSRLVDVVLGRTEDQTSSTV